MEVFIELENGEEKKISDATLVEQNIERLYVEDERINYSERYPNAKLIRAKGCETIGYVDGSTAEIIEDASESEQETDETVRIVFEDGEEETVEGEFDRAYTY